MTSDDTAASASIEALFRSAVAAAKEGETNAARGLFLRVTETDPGLASAWRWRAHLAEGPRQQVAYLRRALDLEPQDTRTRVALTRALLKAAIASAKGGARAEARRTFLEATELDPGAELAWLWLASLYDDIEEKRRCVDRVLEIDPHHPRALAWKGSLVAAATPSSRPGPAGPEGPFGGPRQRPPIKVLVVDDSVTVRSIVSRTLQRRGFEVHGAASPDQALAQLEATTPDLIFLDIDLPQMDGFDLCRRIKARPATGDVPIIMLTGKDGLFDKFRGKMVGAQSYITKPFVPEDLVQAVEEHTR